MCAPVWLLFPGDAACAPAGGGGGGGDGGDGACAGAFMFGDSWLAKPVVAYQQREAWVWLPALPAGASWVYAFGDQKSYGRGGLNVTLETPIDEFPLFYIQRA
jgi:hypothetical protein